MGARPEHPGPLRRWTSLPRFAAASCGMFGLAWLMLGLVTTASTSSSAVSFRSGLNLTDTGLSSRDCVSCHRFEQVLSHPVDITPRMKVPADLPLEGGKVTCLTCHQVSPDHVRGHGAATVRDAQSGQRLCVACHGQSQARDDTHARAGSVPAHLSRRADPRSAGELDAESVSCLTCHDGIAASDSDTRATSRDAILGSGNHPIGVRYRPGRRTFAAEDARLVETAALDKRVRLFGSTIGCGSCHSVYSTNDSLLVVSNSRSRLCLSCHAE